MVGKGRADSLVAKPPVCGQRHRMKKIPGIVVKQILQSLKSGATEVADMPCPRVRAGQVLIRTHATLVSAGTERMLAEFGRAGWLDKARQQPEKVRMVIEKIRTDGLLQTLDAVRSKLDEPMPMGYCNAGTVIEVGAGVEGFAVGDRVASNGRHAELVTVPVNLCAKVPDAVSDEAAAFTVLGAIALQGVRLAQPTLGESFVVSGLGLVGLLTVQLLRAQGCRVLGMDYDAARLALAQEFGAEIVNLGQGGDWNAAAVAFSRGRGVDGVIVAAATASDEPIHQAAQMCRKRGRIVLVGVTGLHLSRADFYEKELSFQVSCSYGPGRYDPEYEQKGRDYPVGFVRWTEQRNFEAVLDMMAEGKLNVAALISHRFPIERAADAYETILGKTASLGVLLEYPGAGGSKTADEPVVTIAVTPRAKTAAAGVPTVGVIGAGNYASRFLMPALRRSGARLKIVASATGASAGIAARKHEAEFATSDADVVLRDPEVAAVVIATRHDSHAALVCDALRAGKHVFVEKPLALTLEELAQIEAALTPSPALPREAEEGVLSPTLPTPGTTPSPSPATRGRVGVGANYPAPILMVGFNRRFAPHARRMKELLTTVAEPKCFVMTVNAGAIPEAHWTQDRESGGGRVIGEVCHFIDLLRFLAGAAITSTQVAVIGPSAGGRVRDDKVSITLGFDDGSIGTIHYFANGHKAFPKERLEVFCAGRILQLDNFRKLAGWGWPGFSSLRLWRQDKGQPACVAAFLSAVRGDSAAPIPLGEIIEVSRVSIEVAEKAR